MPTVSKITVPSVTLPPKKRVAAYARVSMETEMLLHSLSAQVSHYSKLIQSNPEWEYAGVYADEGISGTGTSKRGEFNRLMADCDAGKIDLILAKSVSRFARDTVDCLRSVRHLKAIGVEVQFEREGVSTFTSDGEILLTLLASFAQAESESLSANVKWATRKRFEEGIPNGHKAPYGYRWEGEMFRIIPKQGEVVREIFRRYLKGEPAYAIAKSLTERGITGQNGLPIKDYTVKDIISNISYTGTMILQKNYIDENHVRKHNKGELPRYAVEDMFEPLITMEEYEQAQTIRQKRAAEAANATPVLTKFSGLVKCGWCGCGVSRRTRQGRKIWCCNTRERKGAEACDMFPLQESELNEASVEAVGPLADEDFRKRVKGILIFGNRIEFHLVDSRTKTVKREYGRFNHKKGFTGKLICGDCGAILGRDTWKDRKGSRVHAWGCMGPRSGCGLKHLHETELLEATAAILKTPEPEADFVETVNRAVVFCDSIRYEMKDGTVQVWQRE